MQFANNAVTTLASGITAIATSMTVTSAVAFPTLTGAQYFYCTLIDAATGLIIEIVKVTAVVASVFTIVRGQDGTTASAYLTGDKVELRLVRAELNDFPKLDEDNTFTGNITVATLIPTSSTVPTNGVYLPTANSVGFATNSTNAITINSTQQVGIGATSPTSLLQVGSGTFSSTMTGTQVQLRTASGTAFIVMGNANAADAGVYMGGAASTTVFGRNTDAGVRTETMRLSSTGGVSIGNTTDPGATNLSVTGSSTSTSFIPSSSTVPTNGMYLPAANTLGFATNSTNRLYINAAGVVILAGSTAPLASVGLSLPLGIQVSNTGGGYADLSLASGGRAFYTYTGSVGAETYAERMRLFASGGVSLGNTTDPGATNLSVTGTTTSTGGIVSTSIGATGPSTGAFTGVTVTAGTASIAPIKLTSGTNLTSATAGAIEYDGVNFYATTDTTNGRNVVPEYQQFYLSSNVTAFGPASGDFFGGTSSASLAATTAYDIECFCYFLKTTAGTGQWIPTFSTALTVGHSYLEYTPVTGFTTTVITGAMVTAEASQQTTAVLTHAATASLTTAVSHITKLRIRVLTNTACNFRLKFVGSAGTITPQAGSWYTVRKVASNAGNFVA